MEITDIIKPVQNHLNTNPRYLRLQSIIGKLFSNMNEDVLNDLVQKFIWMELRRGETLCHEGEPGDSLYLLVTGRLKALVKAGSGNMREVGEISQGECVGETALITGEPRSATIKAIRDCTLVKLLKSDFDALTVQHPEVMMRLAKLSINRLNYTMHHTSVPAKITNIALVPATASSRIGQLIQQLLYDLSQDLNVRHLHKELLPDVFKGKFESTEETPFEMSNWLSEQELEQDYVLYEAEPENTLWTQQCLRQADKIILISEAGKGVALSAIERAILSSGQDQISQNIELVLLYPEETEMPALTHTLLPERQVKRHYNIRMNDSRHIQRLSRMITDRGIGLVLGGGGAKGFAHIGIYKALQENNVPVDMVCGTSIGAIIAAAIAHEWSTEELLRKGRSAFVNDKPLNDYTLPVISLLKGHKLQRVNKKYFGDYHIEDMWLNFFCISSNYTLSEMVVHDRGPLWKAVTASVSIPGVLPPVVDGNNLLIDGGSFNNFPVDIMKARYGGRLIGINLLVDKEYKLNYSHLPGGWHMFFSRFFPFLRRYKSPSISAIMLKSTILSSMVHQRKQIEDLELFMTPPVGNFSLLALDKFDEIVKTGYEYGKEFLKAADLSSLSGDTVYHN